MDLYISDKCSKYEENKSSGKFGASNLKRISKVKKYQWHILGEGKPFQLTLENKDKTKTLQIKK